MASTTMQDPRSSQARSAWIAGLTEVCSKITGILNMDTDSFEDLTLIEDRPSDLDAHKFYVSQLGNKLWLTTPQPIIKLNGNIITEQYYEFSIDYLGGCVVFEGDFRPSEDDVITASATYIKGSSQAMKAVTDKLKELEDKAAKNYKGYYSTYTDVETADITGEPGDYVVVEDTNDIYVWNEKIGKFESTYKIPDLSNYYTKPQTDKLLLNKEPNIIAHGNNLDDDSYYYSGRKTWVSLYEMVRDTALSGIVFTDNSKILETDTVSEALGKLQAQIDSNIYDIISTGEPTKDTEGHIGQEYINSSNGDKYHLTTITEDGKYIWEKYADFSNVVRVTGGGNVKLNGDFEGPPYQFEFTPDTDTHVNSFNSRVGDVTPNNGDYDATQVTFSPGNTGMTSNNVDSAIKELFISGSEGKSEIASALTSKGIPTAADASFDTIVENIKKIPTIPKLTSPAEAGNVLSGKEIVGSDGSIITGTMPTITKPTPSITVSSSGLITAKTDQTQSGYVISGTATNTKQLTTQEGTTITPGTSQKTAVSSGRYTTGPVYVAGDSNLIPSNIKSGVSIFGVSGNLSSSGYNGNNLTSVSISSQYSSGIAFTFPGNFDRIMFIAYISNNSGGSIQFLGEAYLLPNGNSDGSIAQYGETPNSELANTRLKVQKQLNQTFVSSYNSNTGGVAIPGFGKLSEIEVIAVNT